MNINHNDKTEAEQWLMKFLLVMKVVTGTVRNILAGIKYNWDIGKGK